MKNNLVAVIVDGFELTRETSRAYNFVIVGKYRKLDAETVASIKARHEAEEKERIEINAEIAATVPSPDGYFHIKRLVNGNIKNQLYTGPLKKIARPEATENYYADCERIGKRAEYNGNIFIFGMSATYQGAKKIMKDLLKYNFKNTVEKFDIVPVGTVLDSKTF